MHRVNVILLAVGMAFLVTPSTAAGRRVHLTCQDGDPQVLLDGRPAPFDQATCDSVADGVCAFTVFHVPFVPCACPTIGCCETTVTSEVPLKRRKRIPRGSYSLVLRCLPLAHTVPCEGPDAPTVHLSTDIQPIFDRSCAVAGCHLGPLRPQRQDLSAGQAFSFTVGVNSTEKPTLLRISPGHPDKSYLLQKIEGTPGIAGVQMPPGCPGTALNGAQCLSVEDITVIRQWITECALNN
jgi:hypothetical protein